MNLIEAMKGIRVDRVHQKEKGESMRRKSEHVELALTAEVEPKGAPPWDEISLVHCCLPECDLNDIKLSTRFCDRHFRYPLIISALTGGFKKATIINEVLAKAADHFSIGMEVGSQRLLLKSPELEWTYSITRKVAPDIFLVANIGAPQLVVQPLKAACKVDEIQKLIETLKADALAIHLNFLQEAVMLDGDTNASRCLEAIGKVTRSVAVPVIVKETGAGISRVLALKLKEQGVAALEVTGVGGTSMALLESYRAKRHRRPKYERLGQTFAQWGIPTPVAVVEAKDSGLPVIAGGGIRTGLDAAKALALGADLVGIARPLLNCAVKGLDATVKWLDTFFDELRVAMFLSGASSLEEMKTKPTVILGKTKEWLHQLKYDYDYQGSEPLPR